MIERDVAHKYTLIIFIKTATRYHDIGASRAVCREKWSNEITLSLVEASERVSRLLFHRGLKSTALIKFPAKIKFT